MEDRIAERAMPSIGGSPAPCVGYFAHPPVLCVIRSHALSSSSRYDVPHLRI
jgi:hypothetical protein